MEPRPRDAAGDGRTVSDDDRDRRADRQRHERQRFDDVVLPHLDAAFNLARWLVGTHADAQDVVQDAFLRALRHFDGYRGGDARSWVLSIVRRCSYTWLARNKAGATLPLEDDAVAAQPGGPEDPEIAALRGDDRRRLRALIERLPPAFREVLVLRDLEEMSYREIATACDIPVGTVMSRLARARTALRRAWESPIAKGPGPKEKDRGV
ncbi:MAG: sigma-70 family RNA polymerase sigma factor [Alphaproteobacteria bacterium]|nr:sigma-70 family RNA polymerase sigma factor [Alphaproteobacteria bacterium]